MKHDVLLQFISAFLSLMSISGRTVGQEKRGHGQEKNFTAVTEYIQANCEWGICYCSSEPMARWSLAHSNDLLAFLGKCSVTTVFQLCCLSCIAGSVSTGNFKDSSNTKKIWHMRRKHHYLFVSTMASSMTNFTLWLAFWNPFKAMSQMAGVCIWGVGSTTLKLSQYDLACMLSSEKSLVIVVDPLLFYPIQTSIFRCPDFSVSAAISHNPVKVLIEKLDFQSFSCTWCSPTLHFRHKYFLE